MRARLIGMCRCRVPAHDSGSITRMRSGKSARVGTPVIVTLKSEILPVEANAISFGQDFRHANNQEFGQISIQHPYKDV